VKNAKAGIVVKKDELIAATAHIGVDAGTLKWSVP
jgi:hypothetical protein